MLLKIGQSWTQSLVEIWQNFFNKKALIRLYPRTLYMFLKFRIFSQIVVVRKIYADQNVPDSAIGHCMER